MRHWPSLELRSASVVRLPRPRPLLARSRSNRLRGCVTRPHRATTVTLAPRSTALQLALQRLPNCLPADLYIGETGASRSGCSTPHGARTKRDRQGATAATGPNALRCRTSLSSTASASSKATASIVNCWFRRPGAAREPRAAMNHAAVTLDPYHRSHIDQKTPMSISAVTQGCRDFAPVEPGAPSVSRMPFKSTR